MAVARAVFYLMLVYQAFRIATWNPSHYPYNKLTTEDREFDYIIVGAGKIILWEIYARVTSAYKCTGLASKICSIAFVSRGLAGNA